MIPFQSLDIKFVPDSGKIPYSFGISGFTDYYCSGETENEYQISKD